VRIGFFLPNLGPAATPEGIVAVARAAEDLDLDSLWVTERLLQPVNPSVPFPGNQDGTYPAAYSYALDPLLTLAWAAAETTKVRLGTSILNVNYYNPALLARQLTTLDILSSGRLNLGIGIGWHPEEFAAVGVDMRDRTRRLEEFVAVIKQIWTENPVRFEGEFYSVPESSILPKPVQKPHPPILLGGFVPAVWLRAARIADGIHPGGLTQAQTVDCIRIYREALSERSASSGASPGTVVMRAQLEITDADLGEGRAPYSGSAEQIRTDIRAAHRAGVDELVFDPTNFSADLAAIFRAMNVVRDLSSDL
jgi:probable F420-dependent oxidoreductase